MIPAEFATTYHVAPNLNPDDLAPRERALFGVLARRPFHVLTKDEILRAVPRLKTTRSLDSAACILRNQLRAGGAPRGTVANVWGVGYRLASPEDAAAHTIRDMIARGDEHIARDKYGDRAVDDVLAADGWNVEQAR